MAPAQKRAADSPGKTASRKRAILGDITNPNNPAAVAAAKAGVKAAPKKAVLRARGVAVASTSKAVAGGKPVATAEQPQEKATSADKAPQTSTATLTGSRKVQEQPVPEPMPAGVVDFDFESRNDPFAESTYASDIFNYYKERELQFVVDKYLERQDELSVGMRSVLVDWMVEVQENFELNHETLYLAVKLVDRYLSRAACPKARLQLVGATALFVACKFDERCPPSVRDFLYICDDAYSHDELIGMEAQLLKALDYELGVPLSYRFLRRYARCGQLPLETLTLARYVLESSLLDYTLVDQRESRLAAAALLQALLMKGLSWNTTLEHYSGYGAEELRDIQRRMNHFLSQQQKGSLEAIRSKYSHKVFFEVALTPLLPAESS